MTDLGEFSETRPACDDIHVPATYNPWMGLTWCWCGGHQWHGRVPTLHARALYDGVGQGARRVGHDIYWLEPA